MKFIQFQFNNFFDYSIIVEQLKSKMWVFNPNEFILTFPYTFTSKYAIKHIKDLCKPLNIQFTITLGVTEDPE